MSGSLVTVAISNYYMIAAIVLLGAVFLKIRHWYVASAKDIKHLEGIGKQFTKGVYFTISLMYLF